MTIADRPTGDGDGAGDDRASAPRPYRPGNGASGSRTGAERAGRCACPKRVSTSRIRNADAVPATPGASTMRKLRADEITLAQRIPRGSGRARWSAAPRWRLRLRRSIRTGRCAVPAAAAHRRPGSPSVSAALRRNAPPHWAAQSSRHRDGFGRATGHHISRPTARAAIFAVLSAVTITFAGTALQQTVRRRAAPPRCRLTFERAGHRPPRRQLAALNLRRTPGRRRHPGAFRPLLQSIRTKPRFVGSAFPIARCFPRVPSTQRPSDDRTERSPPGQTASSPPS